MTSRRESGDEPAGAAVDRRTDSEAIASAATGLRRALLDERWAS